MAKWPSTDSFFLVEIPCESKRRSVCAWMQLVETQIRRIFVGLTLSKLFYSRVIFV
jgi:hypothetical protein